MNASLKSAIAVAAVALASQAMAQATFYEDNGFRGRSFISERPVVNFSRVGFNDRVSSIVVLNERLEVCQDANFSGRCVVLRPGRYPELSSMGMNDKISSARTLGRRVRVDEERFAPPPEPVYDNHRRNNERTYEADVTSVRAVVGPVQQRCWVEREQVVQERSSNAGGTIAGALIGGILGHQVGGGSGKDLATAGGAIAGAVVGSNMGRDNNGQQVTSRNVQRCANVPSNAKPEFWDVSYNFRGIEHRIQMTSAPGTTISVNRQGEPRN